MKLWTDDGRMPDHGHPISTPGEPNGSGELKTRNSYLGIEWHFIFEGFR